MGYGSVVRSLHRIMDCPSSCNDMSSKSLAHRGMQPIHHCVCVLYFQINLHVYSMCVITYKCLEGPVLAFNFIFNFK
jgi:hypothetical protein